MDCNRQCETCAFAPDPRGTAAGEVWNRFRAMISVIAGTPFWCHHDKDGAEYDWRGQTMPASVAFLRVPPNKRRICAGWKQRVRELAARGHFRGGRRLAQKAYGQCAYDALEQFTARTATKKQKRNARADLWILLAKLRPKGGIPE